MFFKSRLSIKEEVFYLGIAFTITILVIFGILFSNYLGNISIDRAKNTIMKRNKQIGVFTERLFVEVTNTIEVLSKNPDVINAGSGDEEGDKRALALYQDFYESNSNISYIYSGYEDGLLLINDYTPPPGFDPTERPWYIAAAESKPAQSVGLPYREAISEEWLISQSKALLDERGDLVGVVAIDLSLEEIINMLDQDHLYDTQHSYILDRNGEIIVHANEELLGETFPEVTKMIVGRQGELTYNYDDTTLWAHYNTIDSTGWIVVTAVDRWEVLKPIIERIALYTLIIVGVAIALGILQSKLIGKRFADPLIALGDRIKRIAEGKDRDEMTYRHSNKEIARILRDIEQLTEHSLQRKANELKTIIESTQDGILVVDNERQVIYVNSRFKELWHFPPDEPISSDDHELLEMIRNQLLNPDSYQERTEELYSSYQIERDTLTFKDGRVYERFTRPLIGEGQLLGRLWSFRDITERKQAEEKLHIMATTDELTGLSNRRSFMDAARQELERSRRYGHFFSLISFDLDHFKKVNDTWGHAAGDATLQHLAALLKSSLRDVDIPGRIGGEEFSVLLPNTDLEKGLLLAERLRKEIEQSPVRYEDNEIYFTVSLGVTAYREGVSSVDELFKAADEALYEAKSKGRNCTVSKIP